MGRETQGWTSRQSSTQTTTVSLVSPYSTGCVSHAKFVKSDTDSSKLGAFGFLSSDEVFRNGVVNAGILDQTFALEWVQAYGGLFGGNTSQVTISGESAGGGYVPFMLLYPQGLTVYQFSYASRHGVGSVSML